ncbi:MAG: stage V sporulation protein AE [Defluviitaleaceae bacterium]|nr:stage V sporulation protein AE [Defluviitaleaceae bacterium]MCL2240531.1 stage V sporulation protein AE [Defluviitaleaceae bacterium]
MTLLWAFIIGGLICVVGQLLIDLTKLTPARILVLFVVAGCLLSGIGWYQRLVDFAGAGALVPLPGFGHILATGVKKAVDERGLIGVITGGFTAMAGGVTVAIVFGYLAALVSKPSGDTP